MPQVAIASTDTRIDGKHSRVAYYEERDMEAYYITDEALAQLCQDQHRRTIALPDDMLIDLIDDIGENENRRAFL